jgi:hypothetical protein
MRTQPKQRPALAAHALKGDRLATSCLWPSRPVSTIRPHGRACIASLRDRAGPAASSYGIPCLRCSLAAPRDRGCSVTQRDIACVIATLRAATAGCRSNSRRRALLERVDDAALNGGADDVAAVVSVGHRQTVAALLAVERVLAHAEGLAAIVLRLRLGAAALERRRAVGREDGTRDRRPAVSRKHTPRERLGPTGHCLVSMLLVPRATHLLKCLDDLERLIHLLVMDRIAILLPSHLLSTLSCVKWFCAVQSDKRVLHLKTAKMLAHMGTQSRHTRVRVLHPGERGRGAARAVRVCVCRGSQVLCRPSGV